MQKIEFFEYFLYQMLSTFDIKNYRNENGYINADIGMLKAQKLLFFTCSLSAINFEKENTDLFDFFDKFYAMPFGHVESEVYSYPSQNFIYFNFSRNSISQIKFYKETDFIVEPHKNRKELFKKILIQTFSDFKIEISNLFDDSNYEIVEKSHRLTSWRNYYDIALSKNKNSEFIPIDFLRRESKFITPVLA